jgi:hypothetical protein
MLACLFAAISVVPHAHPALRPSPAAIAAHSASTDAPQLNASTTWLTQMSAQVHHALVEAKKLEQRVAAAAALHEDANETEGVHGDALLREVTFKPGLMDAGLSDYRRSLLLHDLATSCRLVVVLDDPDPSSRDATFLSMWQLDGKSEPARPVHANGGDGYRKLRMALSGLAWQKHDKAHTAFAKRFYQGRVDAGFYSTRWYWLSASYDNSSWLTYDQFSNASRAAATAPPPASPPSPPMRFTPPSSPLGIDVLDATQQGLDAGSGEAREEGSPEEPSEEEEEEEKMGVAAAKALVPPVTEGHHPAFVTLPPPEISEPVGSLGNRTRLGNGTGTGTAHVEGDLDGEAETSLEQHSPPVLGLQGLTCYKLIALFKQNSLEPGRKALTAALLPGLLPLQDAVAATALHDAELQKMLVLVLARAPLNMSALAESVQQSATLAPLLSEPLVTEVYSDAAIYWPGSL